MNMVERLFFRAQFLYLLKYWLWKVQPPGHYHGKDSSLSVDSAGCMAPFSVHLTHLLSILVRRNDNAGMIRSAPDHQTITRPPSGVNLALGHALQFLLSPITEQSLVVVYNAQV